jgi:hypothetical protein
MNGKYKEAIYDIVFGLYWYGTGTYCSGTIILSCGLVIGLGR